MTETVVLSPLKILGGRAHPNLTTAIGASLGVKPSDRTIGEFPDGELDVKVLDNVRGADVFIIQPTCFPQNTRLMELLMLIDSIRRASADRITAVVPYYGYARKDRKDEGRVPITAKLVANMIATAGADRLLTVDMHAPQIQGFFDIPVDHLYARPVLLKRIRALGLSNLVCASPDIGSMKMAIGYARELSATVASCHKERIGPRDVTVDAVVGDVRGKNVLMVDDLIVSGQSLVKASIALRAAGAADVYVCATHGVFSDDAYRCLDAAPVRKVIVTDTIPLREGIALPAKFEVVPIAGFLAEAIRRIHLNLSVSEMFKTGEF